MEDLVRRGAVSRRELLRTAAASASVLSALAACTSEERASRGQSPSSATFAVPAASSTSATSTATTLDPAAASSVLDRDGLVMDVQLHFLDPDRNTGGFGGGFPQADCGPDPRLCFTQDVFLDLVFGQSTRASGSSPACRSRGATAPSPSTSWSGPACG